MTEHAQFYAGDTVRIQATIRDYDGTLTSPDTTTRITITGPTGTVEVAGTTDMTEASTGVYYYLWQSAVDDVEGIYRVKITAVHSTYTSLAEPRLFSLVQ